MDAARDLGRRRRHPRWRLEGLGRGRPSDGSRPANRSAPKAGPARGPAPSLRRYRTRARARGDAARRRGADLGTWRHPANQSHRYKELDYWTQTARTVEESMLDALFIADALGVLDVHGGRIDKKLKQGVQTPSTDPLLLVSAMAAVTRDLGFAVSRAHCARRSRNATQGVQSADQNSWRRRAERRTLPSAFSVRSRTCRSERTTPQCACSQSVLAGSSGPSCRMWPGTGSSACSRPARPARHANAPQ